MNGFLRLERITTTLALWLAIALLVISVSLGFYQVVTRFVFDSPSTWSEVAARSVMIWCVFLGAAPTFRIGAMMAVEAGCDQGWHRYIGRDGVVAGVNRFGASAPWPVLFEKFGLTVKNITERAKKLYNAKKRY